MERDVIPDLFQLCAKADPHPSHAFCYLLLSVSEDLWLNPLCSHVTSGH